MKKAKLILLAGLAIAVSLTGCQKKEVKPGDVAGYDEGEQYLSIWVHSIEDTLEGQVYRESVDSFNEKYNGKYFADIEFIPRNDSGGGYSDKVLYCQEGFRMCLPWTDRMWQLMRRTGSYSHLQS